MNDSEEYSRSAYVKTKCASTGNEIDFVLSEAQRLRMRYPKIQVTPLLYRVEDNLLYQVKEN